MLLNAIYNMFYIAEFQPNDEWLYDCEDLKEAITDTIGIYRDNVGTEVRFDMRSANPRKRQDAARLWYDTQNLLDNMSERIYSFRCRHYLPISTLPPSVIAAQLASRTPTPVADGETPFYFVDIESGQGTISYPKELRQGLLFLSLFEEGDLFEAIDYDPSNTEHAIGGQVTVRRSH